MNEFNGKCILGQEHAWIVMLLLAGIPDMTSVRQPVRVWESTCVLSEITQPFGRFPCASLWNQSMPNRDRGSRSEPLKQLLNYTKLLACLRRMWKRRGKACLKERYWTENQTFWNEKLGSRERHMTGLTNFSRRQ